MRSYAKERPSTKTRHTLARRDFSCIMVIVAKYLSRTALPTFPRRLWTTYSMPYVVDGRVRYPNL